MKFIIQLILALLEKFAPALVKNVKPASKEGAGVGETEKKLGDKLKEDGWS